MNTTKLPASVIILAHQNDEHLRQAVASAAWATEIVIIWFGKEALHDFPHAHVVQGQAEQPISDFAATRNEAMRAAHFDWVFFLDSDEVVTEQSIPFIQKIIATENVDGVWVHRHDVFLNKELHWGETGKMQLIRLFKKSKTHFERPVHEVAIVDGCVTPSQIMLLHYGHESISSFWQKIIHYSQIEARVRLQRQQSQNIFSFLAWPVGKFLYNYFWLLGCLDGWRGLIYALVMSTHSFAVRALIWETRTKETDV